MAGIRRALNKEGTTEEVDESLNKEGATEEVDEVLNKEEADDHHHDDKDNDKSAQKVMKQKSGTG